MLGPNAMENQINNDLDNYNTWAYQWKMIFNPDTGKQAQEVIFSHKIKVITRPQFVVNNNPVHKTSTQKHLEMLFRCQAKFPRTF